MYLGADPDLTKPLLQFVVIFRIQIKKSLFVLLPEQCSVKAHLPEDNFAIFKHASLKRSLHQNVVVVK